MLFRRKKKLKEPKDNPYKGYIDKKIKQEVEHQNIGGKTIYIERTCSAVEVMRKYDQGNIAAFNFVNRRPDLFDGGESNRETFKHSYYYGHVFNNPEHLGKNNDGCWLGYFVADDDLEEIE